MLGKWFLALTMLGLSSSGLWADEDEPANAAKQRTFQATEIRLMADGSYQIQGQVQAVDAGKGTLTLKTTGVVEVAPGTIHLKVGGAAQQEFTLGKDVKFIGADGKEIADGLKSKVFENPGGLVSIAFVKKDGKPVVTQVKVAQGTAQLAPQLKLLQRPGWVQIDGKQPEKAPVPAPGAPAVRRIELKRAAIADRPASAPAPSTPVDTDRERRLRAIEDQLQKLLREVQELRGGHSWTVRPDDQRALAVSRLAALQQQLQTAARAQPMKFMAAAPQPQVIALSRASYTLPKASADQLVALLKEVKAQVMEVKIEGNAIVVTTTPEAQTRIAQFVALLAPQPSTTPLRMIPLRP